VLFIQLWVLLGILTLLTATVSAQTAPTNFTGIDLVMLVDQSGSMSGAYQRQPSDPNNLRFLSADQIMQFIGDFKHYGAPDAVIRLSIIYFGDPERTITIDWTELSPTGINTSQWERQKIDLSALLTSDAFGARNFGYTNFEGALRKTQEQFDRLAPLPHNGQNLRVVLIVTD